MTDHGLLVAAAGLLLAGVIKGATGIGYSTCALPFLAIAVGFKSAMAIVIIPAIASNVATMWNIGKLDAVFSRFWRFYLGIVPGIAVGAAILTRIDAVIAAQLLGILTLAYVGLAWLKPALSLPPHLERPLAVPAGILNGIFTGLTGSQVMPLMPYFMALHLERNIQIQAINLAVTLASVVLAAALIPTGIMTRELAYASCLGAIPALIGVNIGLRFGQSLSAQSFRQFSLATLAVLALPLMLRAKIVPDASVDNAPSSPSIVRTAIDPPLSPGQPTSQP